MRFFLVQVIDTAGYTANPKQSQVLKSANSAIPVRRIPRHASLAAKWDADSLIVSSQPVCKAIVKQIFGPIDLLPSSDRVPRSTARAIVSGAKSSRQRFFTTPVFTPASGTKNHRITVFKHYLYFAFPSFLLSKVIKPRNLCLQ